MTENCTNYTVRVTQIVQQAQAEKSLVQQI